MLKSDQPLRLGGSAPQNPKPRVGGNMTFSLHIHRQARRTDRYRRLVRRHPRLRITLSCLSHARTSCVCLLPRTRVCCGPGAPLAPDSRPAPDRPHSLARSTCPVAPRLPHAPVSCPRRTRSCQRSRAAEYDLTIISPPTSRVQWIGWRVSACERKCVWSARKTHLWQPPCCCSAAVTLPACRTGAHVRHQHLRV